MLHFLKWPKDITVGGGAGWGTEMLHCDWYRQTETTGDCSCEKIVLKKQDGCGLL